MGQVVVDQDRDGTGLALLGAAWLASTQLVTICRRPSAAPGCQDRMDAFFDVVVLPAVVVLGATVAWKKLRD
jgi:hypothetical protein